jgi:hypothetical protein
MFGKGKQYLTVIWRLILHIDILKAAWLFTYSPKENRPKTQNQIKKKVDINLIVIICYLDIDNIALSPIINVMANLITVA